MLRDLPDPALPRSAGLEAGGGILATRRGWRPQDWLERAALARMQAAGPVWRVGGPEAPAQGLPRYAGFPWSAYLDSLEAPGGLDSAYLEAACRTLGLLAPRTSGPRTAGLITVCQHPRLPDHLDRLAAAGVRDVFWTGALPDAAGGLHPSGVVVHPFPALPAPDMPPVAGEGPGGAFALCPSDAGGNTPRLWGAVAAGLIPVLALRDPVLPGPAGLWQEGAVLPEGDGPQDDAVLAGRLAMIAAMPERLEAMRQALAALHLLYGPGRMIHDVLACLLARSGAAAGHRPDAEPEPGQSLLRPLILRLRNRDRLTPAEAALVLQQAAADLLCSPQGDLRMVPGPQSAAAWRLVALAKGAMPAASPEVLRFDRVLGHLRDRGGLPLGSGTAGRAAEKAAGEPRPGTGVQRRAAQAMRVHLLGPRGQRTPLCYAPMRPHLGDRIAFVDRPDAADLVVTGWSRDLEESRDLLAGLARRGDGGPRLVVLSEEPLWDSLWSGGMTPRDRMLDCGPVQLPYRSLNHVTSDIFAFRHLPWFILSADSFPARYALLMSEFAAMTPQALLGHWARAPWQAAFVAERRQTPDWATAFPAEGVTGLSLYRSRVAELTPGPAILRLGQGWPDTTTRRQDLPDWHLDKLARLHGRLRICGAQENTLQRDYITEKPFDAFAMGAIPAVVADAGHRLFELVLPEAMLNTVCAPPEVAAARIASFVPDLTTAEAWRETAQGLLARCRDTPRILDERQRIADTCVAELRQVLHEGDHGGDHGGDRGGDRGAASA